MTAVRTHASAAMREPQSISNPGLALDRYIPVSVADSDETRRKQRHQALAALCAARPPALYARAFTRWKNRLNGLSGVVTHPFTVEGRLIVGLGGETVHETGITLLRPWGVPYIPGSALKGLAHHYATYLMKDAAGISALNADHMRVLFGTPKHASYITWFDAWYIWGSAPSNQPLALDTLTVHHPAYYRTGGAGTGEAWRRLPTDFDDPNPVSFLSARGAWLLALRGPTPEWTGTAMTILTRALAAWGAGGKTSSGYGLPPSPAMPPAFPINEVSLPDAAATPVTASPGGPLEPAEALPAPLDPQPFLDRIEQLPRARVMQQMHQLCMDWNEQFILEPARRQVAEALYDKLRTDGDMSRAVGKRWYALLRAYLDSRPS